MRQEGQGIVKISRRGEFKQEPALFVLVKWRDTAISFEARPKFGRERIELERESIRGFETASARKGSKYLVAPVESCKTKKRPRLSSRPT